MNFIPIQNTIYHDSSEFPNCPTDEPSCQRVCSEDHRFHERPWPDRKQGFHRRDNGPRRQAQHQCEAEHRLRSEALPAKRPATAQGHRAGPQHGKRLSSRA